MRNKCILLSLFTTFLMAGCVSNVNDTGMASYPLSVQSVSINSVATRASSALAVNDATIGVSTLSGGAVSVSSAYTYSTSTGKWGKASGSSELLAGAGTYLCAYYPYSASITNKAAIPLTSAKYTTAADLSYAYSTAAVQDASTGFTNVSFALQHTYARLTFSFTHDSNYSSAKTINSVSISNPGIYSSAALDITKSTAVYSNKVASDVTFNAGITDIDLSPDASVLMVPTDVLSGNITVLFKVGTETKKIAIPVSLFANSKLEAGVNYRISVFLSTSGTLELSSSNVTTTDWTAGATISPSVKNIVQPESNCYIVAPGSTILIPVSRATTGNAANFPSGASFTTGLLWSDVSDTHVTATVADRYIKVVAGATEGNSVVYAKNTGVNIVWSWHIWVTNYNPGNTANTGTYTTTYSYNSNLWMDRNLGATTTTTANQNTKGLLYQWGRKDPFPGSTTVSGTDEPTLFGEKKVVDKAVVAASPNLVKSIQNPLTFYYGVSSIYDWYTSGTAQNDALWYNGTSLKTIYDPCPPGWRVPNFTDGTSPWNGLTASAGTWSSGYSWTGTPNIGYYPAAGYRDAGSGSLISVGSNSFYWSASVSGTAVCRLFFISGTVNLSTYGNRANGQSVRCVKY